MTRMSRNPADPLLLPSLLQLCYPSTPPYCRGAWQGQGLPATPCYALLPTALGHGLQPWATACSCEEQPASLARSLQCRGDHHRPRVVAVRPARPNEVESVGVGEKVKPLTTFRPTPFKVQFSSVQFLFLRSLYCTCSIDWQSYIYIFKVQFSIWFGLYWVSSSFFDLIFKVQFSSVQFRSDQIESHFDTQSCCKSACYVCRQHRQHRNRL